MDASKLGKVAVKHWVVKRDGQYIVAPIGHYRRNDGAIVADGSPSPEWGTRAAAFVFSTRIYAARNAKNGCGKVIPVHVYSAHFRERLDEADQG